MISGGVEASSIVIAGHWQQSFAVNNLNEVSYNKLVANTILYKYTFSVLPFKSSLNSYTNCTTSLYHTFLSAVFQYPLVRLHSCLHHVQIPKSDQVYIKINKQN